MANISVIIADLHLSYVFKSVTIPWSYFSNIGLAANQKVSQ